MNIKLPESVDLIIRILETRGYEAYAVGGCVRDAVMGRIPNDWDITTSAKAEEVKAIFNKTIDTGLKHGTVTVMINRVGYEVTTFRVDGEYEDGRHPKEVLFTDNLALDLERRDFTINAMAYNYETGIVDRFKGIEDLNNKVIRCVGDPIARFSEDALRILRAVRFAAQLDFDIEEKTIDGIVSLRDNLKKISRERIQVELEKLLMSDHGSKISILYNTGVIPVIFDGVETSFGTKDNNWWIETGNFLEKTTKDHYLRWAVLLRDESEPEKVLKSLKFDNKTISIVSKIIKNKEAFPEAFGENVRRSICSVGVDIYQLYLTFIEEVYGVDVEPVRKIYHETIENNHCLSIGTLAVKGSDLKEIGINPGKEMGLILEKLFDMVITNPELNNKDTLLKKVKEFA